MRKSKDIVEEHVKSVRDIGLAFIVTTFVVLGMAGAFVAYERQLEREALINQEARVQW